MPGIKELLPSCLPRPCWVPPPGLLPLPYPSSTCNLSPVLLTFISKSLTEFSSSPIPAAPGLSTIPGQPFPGLSPASHVSAPTIPLHPVARGSFLKSILCCSPCEAGSRWPQHNAQLLPSPQLGLSPSPPHSLPLNIEHRWTT